MLSPCRKLVLAALVVILPLQALASVAPEEAAPAAMTLDGGHCLNHDDRRHGRGTARRRRELASLLSALLPGLRRPGRAVARPAADRGRRAIALFADLFIPDLPQRPPRA